jgi:hypothetical protein
MLSQLEFNEEGPTEAAAATGRVDGRGEGGVAAGLSGGRMGRHVAGAAAHGNAGPAQRRERIEKGGGDDIETAIELSRM